MRLNGKVAVITGGNSGIGLAIARAFVREGAKVAISGRNAATLATARHELGEEALAVEADITHGAELLRLFAAVKARFGRIDVVVANAGINRAAPIEFIDESAIDALLSTNIKGTFLTVQKALPLLGAGASVILIGSTLSHKGVPMMSIYSASKAAQRSLARSLASELAPRQIRVNVISPGTIDTPLYDKFGLPPEQVAANKVLYAKMTPLGRMGVGEDIAAGAVYLASDESSFVTGSELAIDGGFGQL